MIISDHLRVIPVILVADIRSTIISPTDLDLKPFNLNGKVAFLKQYMQTITLSDVTIKRSNMELEIRSMKIRSLFSVSKDRILPEI